MRMETKTAFTPYPAAAALAFIVLVVGHLWWESRPSWAAREALALVPAETRPAPKPVAKAVPAAVVAFASFAKEDLPVGWPATREKTASGLKLLAGAMAARGDSVLWRDRALRLAEAATGIEKAADAEEAASLAQGALVQAADWVEDLGVSGASSSQPVIAAAAAIDAREPLREQAGELERFFEAAAQALGAAA